MQAFGQKSHDATRVERQLPSLGRLLEMAGLLKLSGWSGLIIAALFPSEMVIYIVRAAPRLCTGKQHGHIQAGQQAAHQHRALLIRRTRTGPRLPMSR